MTIRSSTTIAVLLCISVAAFAAEDPFVGTWKLSLAKSKFDPGPPLKSSVYKYESSSKGGLKNTVISVDAQGKENISERNETYDGKVHSRPDPITDKASLKRVDAYTIEGTTFRHGQVYAHFTRVISKDGKTLTIKAEGTNLQGRKYHDVRVFDKQ